MDEAIICRVVRNPWGKPACEPPIRGTTVSVVRRPLQRQDSPHRTGSKRRAEELKGSRAAGLIRPVFFPQPFKVRVDPSSRPRGLELEVDIIVKGLILAQNERGR